MKKTCLVLLLFFYLSPAQAGNLLHFSVRDDHGLVYTAEDYHGRELLLYVMSFQCASCLRHLPTIDGLLQRRGEGLAVLGLVYGDHDQSLTERARELHIRFPLAWGERELAMENGIDVSPSILWLDERGRLRDRFIGSQRVRQLPLLLDHEDGIGLSQLVAQAGRFQGQSVTLSGLLSQTTSYARKPVLFLTNGRESVRLTGPAIGSAATDSQGKAWSSLLGRPLLVKGTVIGSGKLPALRVEQIISTEKNSPRPSPSERREAVQ